MLRKQWIDCNCSAVEHTLRFLYFDDDTDIRDHDLYIDVYLVKNKWYKRIWLGIKYIFGYQSKYGNFTEIIYDAEKVKELKAFLGEYLEDAPKRENKSAY